MAQKPCLRVSNPPGGRTNDIFGTEQAENGPQRRTVKDHQKSNIFSLDSNSNQIQTGLKMSPYRSQKTGERLFGGEEAQKSPRRLTDTYRSQLFDPNAEPTTPTATPKKSPARNPITGDGAVTTNGHEAGPMVNGLANGHASAENGHGGLPNGLSNGNANEGTTEAAKKGRQPPGGYCNGIF